MECKHLARISAVASALANGGDVANQIEKYFAFQLRTTKMTRLEHHMKLKQKQNGPRTRSILSARGA